MTYTDCIFFEEREADTGMKHCLRSRILDNGDSLCDYCRLWDAYIPKSSSVIEREKAIEWQNMPLEKQPDYEDYFKIDLAI